jgi:outer membrane protein assembly factor BamB
MRRNGGGVRNGSTRRGVLLGSAGLMLAGCDALDIFGENKVPLPGERHSVLRRDRTLAADEGLTDRAVELPPPAPLTEWPQAGGRPDHAPGHPALGTGLRQAWSTSAGSGSAYRQRLTSGPVVAGGHVFTVDAFGEVACFDLARGNRRWSLDTRPEEEWDGALGGGAAFADGTLYIATGLSELLAINAESGEVRWRVRLPAPARGAPTVAGGRIFLPTIENQLLALSTEDGRRLWIYRAGPISTVPLGMPAPAVEGETVVAGFATGELAALRVSDGRVQWTESLSGGGTGSLADIVGIRAMPVVDRGRVFAQGLGNVTLAVDLRSGRRLWEREFGGDATPWSAGDWVFAVSGAGEALAIGRNDGRIRWLTELAPEDGRSSDEVVRWAGPVLAGGRLIICGSGSEALELNPANGEILGRVSLPGPVTLPVAVADGSLVVLTDDGTVAALRPSAG